MNKIALVRKPSDNFLKCITNHSLKHKISLKKAQKQHEVYCNTLKEYGLEVIYCKDIPEYPDSCFVEDTAIIHNEKALICRFGAESRRGEENSVEEILEQYLKVSEVKSPGTIEGGDVLHFSNHFISGISQRTNFGGIKQLEVFTNIPVNIIEDNKIIHLKSYVTALKDNLVITTNKYKNHPVLRNYEKIVTPKNEEYAANTLNLNGTVLIPEGFLEIKNNLLEYGLDVLPLDTSEFQKCEGSLTCLSLIF